MEAVKESITDHIQLSIDIRLNEPVNLNPEYIQEVMKRLITNNPQAWIGNSPEEILQHFAIIPHKVSPPISKETSKIKMLQRLKQHSMSPESLKKFNEGRKEFRENFIMKNPFLDEET